MHKVSNTILAGLAIAALIPLTACGPDDAEDAEMEYGEAIPAPTGQVWALQAVSGDEPMKIADPDRYTLEFMADGTYQVRADCNSGSGTYSYEDGQLSIQPGPLTLAACGPDSYSAKFLEGLGGMKSFVRSDDALVVNLASGAAMNFAPLPTSAALGGTETLAGSTWQVTGYNNGRGGVTTPVAATELTVAFGADGTVSGSAGCNTFSGTYAVDDADGVAFGTLAAAQKMCVAEGVMEQESQFLSALTNSTNWQIRGYELEMRNNEGALQVKAKR